MGSLQPVSGQAETEMVASKTEEAVALRGRQSTRKASLDRLYYIGLFREDEALQCSELKELKLMAGEMLRQKTVSNRKRRFGEEQQTGTALLQSKVRNNEGQAVPRGTAVSFERNRAEK